MSYAFRRSARIETTLAAMFPPSMKLLVSVVSMMRPRVSAQPIPPPDPEIASAHVPSSRFELATCRKAMPPSGITGLAPTVAVTWSPDSARATVLPP